MLGQAWVPLQSASDPAPPPGGGGGWAKWQNASLRLRHIFFRPKFFCGVGVISSSPYVTELTIKKKEKKKGGGGESPPATAPELMSLHNYISERFLYAIDTLQTRKMFGANTLISYILSITSVNSVFRKEHYSQAWQGREQCPIRVTCVTLKLGEAMHFEFLNRVIFPRTGMQFLQFP